MEIRLGAKIKALRKQKGISQETLANALGVTYQSVSKWETGSAMPDVALVPAIASFFSVSTDELFDFNLAENEKQVQAICDAAYEYRESDPEKSEAILREGLKRFPGNDIILNNILYCMDWEKRSEEAIDICKALVECTRLDDVKYDAYRILATIYRDTGNNALVKPTIEKIPEIYFTKLELDAELLEGGESAEAAMKQKHLSAETLVDMILCLSKHYRGEGDDVNACTQIRVALGIIDAFADEKGTRGSNAYSEKWLQETKEIICRMMQ